MSWVAYADESIRSRPDGTGAYIMGAACLESVSCDTVRPIVAELARPRTRFHWRDADDRQRRAAVALVAGLPALHIIVVGTPLDPHRQERARRHCLARLLYELERANVEQLWLESRTQILNTRDLQAVNVFRIQHTLSDDLRVDHTRPLDEPLLWLPDVVAGAVYTALDDDVRYLSQLEPLIDVHNVELR